MKFIFWNEDHCKLLVLHSEYLLYMHSFSVLTLWHTYADSHPDNGSKRSHYGLENCHILLKNVLLKMNFQHCLFYILTFYHKLLLFQFLGHRICLQIPILTGVQKGHVSLWKSGHNLLKKIILKLDFQHHGHFYAYCLIYTLIIYCKGLLLQFLSCGTRMQIPILTGV